MAWITPKTDWTSANGVDFNDYNRIEGDIAFIATNPSGANVQLAPGGGSVLINTTAADAKLHVAGNFKLTGSVGEFLIDQSGAIIDFTRNTVNYIRAITAGGFLAINTNGTTGTSDSNVVFNIDKSTTFNGSIASISINDIGNSIEFDRNNISYIWNISTGGFFAIGTNGLAKTEANANAVFNDDQSTTFKKAVDIEAGGLTVTGTTHPFIVKATGFLDDTWMDGIVYAKQGWADGGVWFGEDASIWQSSTTANFYLRPNTDEDKDFVFVSSGGYWQVDTDLAVNNVIERSSGNGVSVQAKSGEQLLTIIINIGDWNMDSSATTTVAHGLATADIRSVDVVIRSDGGTVEPLMSIDTSDGTTLEGGFTCTGTNVALARRAGGKYDTINYNATSYNRGYVYISYVL